MLQGAGGTVQPGLRRERASASAYRRWFLWLVICTALVALALAYVDMPVARHMHGRLQSASLLATGFASIFLLGAEAVVALLLIIVRIVRGHLSPFREATAVACITSICAYAVNDSMLKVFFGSPYPEWTLQGAHHGFHLLAGFPGSFPSGHMVIACAFAGVFMRLYRVSILPLSGLLFIAACLLIAGNWHFVSDVIAGTFIGISAGLLAGEVWLAHSKQAAL